MTVKELATLLDGAEIGREVSLELANEALQSGLVIVHGASDDLMEFAGAINYEADVYEGGLVHLNKNGVLAGPECNNLKCPYYVSEMEKAKTILAVWNGVKCLAPWTYETDIPHEEFSVYEDGAVYCIGIVFSIEDLQ